MQIKKGPYGYYALEKFDSPDKICTYAEEVIAGTKSDFYLIPSTEYIGSGMICCFEFSGFLQITDPEFSVFSLPKKNTVHKKDAKNLSLRRKSVGDLFYSFVKFLDNLIAPSCIVLDPDMVFTDPEGITVKMCCLPIKSSPDDLCLSSLNANKLEKLLNCDFFKSILTNDEINELVYCVKENDEERFLKAAGAISGTDKENTESYSFLNPDSSKTDKIHNLKSYSKEERDLMISCLSAIFSFALLAGKMYLPCFLFFFLSMVILVAAILNQRKRDTHIRKEESQEKSKKRSSILFSDDQSEIANNYSSQIQDTYEQPSHFQPLVSGQLTLISETKGVNPHYSVYLDETCIGSDCFMSDIVLDDPQIAPLHAVIKQSNGTFYLEPAKGTGKTYLEDSPVANGKTYEIKSGQKISFGDIEFRFNAENTKR